MADVIDRTKIAEKRREPPNRVTAVFNVHHEHDGEQPYSIGPVISQIKLEVNEDVYTRRVTVRESWEELDLGHLPADQVGLVIVENLEGRFPANNPTEEERKEAAKKIIEVSTGDGNGGAFLCFPAPISLPFVGYPQDASRIALRCPVGVARCRVHVFPR